MAESLLTLQRVTAGYGDALVLHGISLEVPAHGSLAVLGRNGVGKTTLLLTIMGYTRLRGGTVLWRGADITRSPPNRRAANGIGWVAQEREIFPSLSVEENLIVAARRGPWNLDAAFKLFPRLRERRRNMGHQLSGGEQQMLAISRALAGDTKVLLLDEISMGLAPIIVGRLFELVAAIAAGGVTVVLVEQFAETALGVADRAAIMLQGRIAHEGTPADMSAAAESSYL